MRLIIKILIGIIFTFNANSQCKEPFVPTFTERTTSSIKISWLDNNSSPIGYQIAYAEKGLPLSMANLSPVLIMKNYSLTNLISGNTYNFWIRSICSIGDTSKWAGPYSFTTYLTNPSRCDMDIDIKDNSCSGNSQDQFFIDVNLGNDSTALNLESVSLIIQHTWPADLKIELESPWGETIVLSQFNGTVSDNFGIINSDCNIPTIFADESCESLKEGKPPYAGNFIPEEPISKLKNTNNKNGLWKLKICDDAFNDKGVLKYASLNFAPFACSFVDDYYVTKVSDTSYEVRWKKPENCVNAEISYRKKGNTNFDQKKVINCDSLKIQITGLEPDTEYEFTIASNCGGTNTSSPSCISLVKTLCSKPDLYENFDNMTICEPSCASKCEINSFVINNANNTSDWIVYNEDTPTEFTGPSSGAYNGGNYIYIESNPQVCDTNNVVILETKCLKSSGSLGCDLSFFYHMFGSDVGSLEVQKSSNESNWQSLIKYEGTKVNEWIQTSKTIDQEKESLYKLRFIATTKNGIQSDIGLDEIAITNANLFDEVVYYYDQDSDGFGNKDSIITLCSTTTPAGYSLNGNDCNDKNPQVNPSIQDIPCNFVDENCDGIIELENTTNPISILSSNVLDVSCTGKSDGKISIDIIGGTPPYSFFWNNNEVIEDIENLTSGNYFCRITDANGCGLLTDTFIVGILSEYSVIVQSIINPSCLGKADGSITIEHNSGFPPFKYMWNNGSENKNLQNISNGSFVVSVSDALGCVETSDSIIVFSPETFSALTSFKKNPLCFGQKTGVLEVQGINGKSPYTYIWNTNSNTNKIQNLADGKYVVTITDNNGCKVIYEDSITEPNILEIKLLNVEPARCNGSETGLIKTLTTGGTSPYSYQWSDGGPPLETRNNLKASIYSVNVSDINGCTDTLKSIFVFQPPKLVYQIDSIKHSSCIAKSDGEIFISISGGKKPYGYYWNNTNQNTEDIDSLLPNGYTLTILDGNNCKLTTETIEVLNFNTAQPVNVNLIKSNLCPKESNASISSQITSSALPLDFNWSNGQQNIKYLNKDTLYNLSFGNYNVTITDSDGCVSISENIFIKEIEEFNSSYNIINNNCKDDSLGQILTNINGGTPPYDILWNNGSTTLNPDNLPNGIYHFSLKDDNECVYHSQPILISSKSNIDVIIIKKDTEVNQSSGTCTINPINGVGGYYIEWENANLNGFLQNNLSAGIYHFTLKDDLDCSLDSFVIIDIINDINELNNHDLTLSPNPSSENILIMSEGNLKNITVTNAVGEVVLSFRNVESNVFNIDISNFSNGIYFVDIELSAVKIKRMVIKI